MAIQYDILASTLRLLVDREVDNTFRTVPMLEAAQRAGNVEKIDGGQKVDHPVILAEHSSITQLSTGYEAVNLAVKDPLRTASFDWCDFVAPVVITKKEELSTRAPGPLSVSLKLDSSLSWACCNVNGASKLSVETRRFLPSSTP